MTAFLKIFDMVPGWCWAALLAGSLATGCIKQGQLDTVKLKHAELQSKFDKAKADQADELAKLTAEYRDKENKFQTDKQEVIKNAQAKTKQAAAAVADASAAGDKLRDRIGQITSRCAAPTPSAGTGPGSPPAAAADLVLADVQRRLDKAAEDLAGYADAARIAGQACEVSYDSLRK